MRLRRRLLSIALLSVFLTALARADSVPSLTWTDVATFQGATGGFANFSFLLAGSGTWAATSDGGIAIREFCEEDFSVCQGYTIDRTFTVTTPGAFVLSSSASMDVTTFGCSANPDFGGCHDPVVINLSFLGTTTILGPSRFSETITGAGSNSAPLQNNDNTPVEATATGAGSQVVNLGIGDYTLEQNFGQDIAGTGATEGTILVGIDLSPQAVPEPKGYLATLLVGLAIMFWARCSWRTKNATTSKPRHTSPCNSYLG